MLRALASDNYSPEPCDRVTVVVEALIQRLYRGGSWLIHSGFKGECGEFERKQGVRAFLCDCPGCGVRHPRTGEARVERSLDAVVRLFGTAQPPPLRGAARAALLTRITLV
ncbi:hypothetical protein SGFS_045580 [Streptomyces graminofaciens]|uniref:Uncharacterized protein n=1 Tax=Streptomyces graminofaciens TaxID=68212 RepID=A0ABM7FB48_9ACTN|nr:hypothetical protein SGFS_045580 [Streptomyces graminofaciens]